MSAKLRSITHIKPIIFVEKEYTHGKFKIAKAD